MYSVRCGPTTDHWLPTTKFAHEKSPPRLGRLSSNKLLWGSRPCHGFYGYLVFSIIAQAEKFKNKKLKLVGKHSRVRSTNFQTDYALHIQRKNIFISCILWYNDENEIAVEKIPGQDPAPSFVKKFEESLLSLGKAFFMGGLLTCYFRPDMTVAIRIPNAIIRVNVS